MIIKLLEATTPEVSLLKTPKMNEICLNLTQTHLQ